MKKGRECNVWHATEIMQEIQKGTVRSARLEDGKLQNFQGVIPAVEDMNWEMVYQDREQGKRIPVSGPAEPKLHYAGYGKPLPEDQIRNLLKVQKAER
jgi:hypothetical protein